MDGRWGFKRFKFRMGVMMILMLVSSLFDQNMSVSSSLNSEGMYIQWLALHVLTIP